MNNLLNHVDEFEVLLMQQYLGLHMIQSKKDHMHACDIKPGQPCMCYIIVCIYNSMQRTHHTVEPVEDGHCCRQPCAPL